MSQQRWLVKHPEVEEAFDLLFYRPLGYGLSLLLRPLPVTPDHVSIAAAVAGVAGGHLLLYGAPRLDLAGAVALVVSALLDSVDGQLARLRGTHSAQGRLYDGFSDSVVFISVYLHLGARLVREGGTPGAPARRLRGARLPVQLERHGRPLPQLVHAPRARLPGRRGRQPASGASAA